MGIDKQNKIADRRKADFSVKRLWAFGLPLQIGITYLRCIGTPRICILNSNFLALIVLRSQRYNIPFYSTQYTLLLLVYPITLGKTGIKIYIPFYSTTPGIIKQNVAQKDSG